MISTRRVTRNRDSEALDDISKIGYLLSCNGV